MVVLDRQQNYARYQDQSDARCGVAGSLNEDKQRFSMSVQTINFAALVPMHWPYSFHQPKGYKILASGWMSHSQEFAIWLPKYFLHLFLQDDTQSFKLHTILVETTNARLASRQSQQIYM